jgi:hypothetical protein
MYPLCFASSRLGVFAFKDGAPISKNSGAVSKRKGAKPLRREADREKYTEELQKNSCHFISVPFSSEMLPLDICQKALTEKRYPGHADTCQKMPECT